MTTADVIVLGAGLSGLTAARTLQASGREVIVVDKGRSVGGRLATRRIGDARLDHGAQFFTVRGDDFAAVVSDAAAAGVVYEWCRGFPTGDEPDDGFPRYASTNGMNGLAKWLADGLDVRCGLTAQSVSVDSQGARITDTDGAWVSAPQVVLTAPIPQTLSLLAAGGVALDPALHRQLSTVSYFATLGLLVTVVGEHRVGEPGGEQHEDGPFTFIADNHRKGVSASPALTFHADHDWSARRYDDDPAEVLAELLELAAPWLGDAEVVEAQLKKWRYAGPENPLPERALTTRADGATLVFAGDAFGGPKVEGAFNSGRAAASQLGATN